MEQLDSKYYLAAFKRLRDNYNGEIPAQIVDSTDGNWKVRTGWFNAIYLYGEGAIELGFLDTSCAQKRTDLINYAKSQGLGRNNRRTTREDIRAGDDTLDTFITCLEKQVGEK